ncbi:hypothetical protein OZ411_29655 [Bradyrhizobium sp. Arg237L]|uniref:hypothetical protein n=1 Tax=Bradyrhizobium sp. Arg237L TaxID=3003352 RepID=UPI00249F3B41|nr:hypothetical protein [Bradyrhizobium sp. Arg237L]MDI4236983.1 hypothetical protein [Bradyrhizobium sp. Arg237L]
MAYYWDSQTERDRPPGFHWRLSGLSEALGLDPADRALESLLTEACLAAEDGCAVSYSRSKDFYAGIGRYHGTGWSYRRVLRSAAEATRLGLIRDYRVPPGNRGWQSWLEATEELMGVWRSRPQALHYSPGDPIVLRDANGDSTGYQDTAMTARLRGELREVNDMLSSIKIELDGVAMARPIHGLHQCQRGPKLHPAGARQSSAADLRPQLVQARRKGLRLAPKHSEGVAQAHHNQRDDDGRTRLSRDALIHAL